MVEEGEEMKIYIAAKYSVPENVIDILANIGFAIEAGVEVAKKGHIPHIPHLDCLIAIWAKGALPKNFYYTLGMEALKCCDAILILNGLKTSKGVKNEYLYAKKTNMKIYYRLEDIPDAT